MDAQVIKAIIADSLRIEFDKDYTGSGETKLRVRLFLDKDEISSDYQIIKEGL